jgi:hypothetical protein
MQIRQFFASSFFLVLFFVLVACPALAQHSTKLTGEAALEEHVPSQPTAGKKDVEKAFQFQRRLLHGLETIDTVIKNWARTATLANVKKDHDALAISFGCEGLMEIERDSFSRADSLLKKAMPLFKYKDSKSYFLVALAQLESKRSFYDQAFRVYAEILTNFDSLDALKDITFYSESGYAAYAYGIDAALHITNLGRSIPQFLTPAIQVLQRAASKHPVDALGLMALTGLKYLDSANVADYIFKIEQLCSRKADLRKVADKFELQFAEAKKE